MHSFDVCLHYLRAHQIDEVNIPIFLQLPLLCYPSHRHRHRLSPLSHSATRLHNSQCVLFVVHFSLKSHAQTCVLISSIALRAYKFQKNMCVFAFDREKKKRREKNGKKNTDKTFRMRKWTIFFFGVSVCSKVRCEYVFLPIVGDWLSLPLSLYVCLNGLLFFCVCSLARSFFIKLFRTIYTHLHRPLSTGSLDDESRRHRKIRTNRILHFAPGRSSWSQSLKLIKRVEIMHGVVCVACAHCIDETAKVSGDQVSIRCCVHHTAIRAMASARERATTTPTKSHAKIHMSAKSSPLLTEVNAIQCDAVTAWPAPPQTGCTTFKYTLAASERALACFIRVSMCVCVVLYFVSLWMPDAFRMCLSSVPVGIITTNNNRTSCSVLEMNPQPHSGRSVCMRMTLSIFFLLSHRRSSSSLSLPLCHLSIRSSRDSICHRVRSHSCTIFQMFRIQDEEDWKWKKKSN